MNIAPHRTSFFLGMGLLALPIFLPMDQESANSSPSVQESKSDPIAALGAQLWSEQHQIFEALFPGVRYDLDRIPYRIEHRPTGTDPVSGWTVYGGTFDLTVREVYDVDLGAIPDSASLGKFWEEGLSFTQVVASLSNANGSAEVFGLAIERTLPGISEVRFWPIGKSSTILNAEASCSEDPAGHSAPNVPDDLCGPGCTVPNGKIKNQACIDKRIREYQNAMANACIDYNNAIDAINSNYNTCMKTAAKASVVCAAAAGLIGFFTGGVGGLAATIACGAKLAYDQLQCRNTRDQSKTTAASKLNADKTKAKNNFDTGIKDCCDPCPVISGQ